MVLERDKPGGAFINYPLPTATDNIDDNVEVTCGPIAPAGDIAPINLPEQTTVTQVTCTASDGTNTVTSMFDVIVREGGGELPVTGTSVTLPYTPVRVIEVVPHAGEHVGRTPGRARVEDGA